MVSNVLGAKQEDTASLATVRAESVQDLWNAQRDGAMGMWLFSTQRGPILPAWGTRDRERALRGFYRHEYSTLLQGAFMVLVKKVRATPWEIEGGRNLTNKYQGILRESQFRAGWGDFISRFVLDYLRQDGGAWAEIIAPGDPMRPPTGPATGIAHLDSLWTWPTGDPEYPCVYWSRLGKLHLMHHTRVLHMVDMPDGDQFNPGYGLCALSRAIAVVQRQLYLNRYIVSNLDDIPSPGAVVANNLTRQEVEKAFALFQQQQDSDNLPAWGKVAWLYNLDATKPGSLENFTFSRPPEKFDFPVYVQIDIDEMALAIGMDVQDLRPISSGNVGTAKQTEVLHQKAEGKTFGDILISLERLLNDVLPESLEFKFKTHDPMAAEQEAKVAQLWVGVATSAATLIGAPLAAQLLADNVEQFREVLTDEDGQTIELNDLDPQPSGYTQQINAQLQPQLDAQTQAATTANDRTPQKDYADTRARFIADVSDLMLAARDDELGRRRAGTVMRAQLSRLGRAAFEDGLKAGGIEGGITASDQAALTAWLAEQNAYVAPFLDKVYKSGLTDAQIREHADMWANKSLNDAHLLGLARADSDGVYEWRIGMTEDHCPSCLAMNGQKHRLSEYMARGITPNSSRLTCKGYNCRCSLQKSSGASAGNWLNGVKGLQTDAQRRWYFAHFGKNGTGGMGRLDRLGNLIPSKSPKEVVTLNGVFREDIGKPGDSMDSLTDYLRTSESPLAYAMLDGDTRMIKVDYSGDLDNFEIDRAVVRAEAAAFVRESQDIQYSREYILSLARSRASENGVNIDDKDIERVFNQQYAYRAEAIQRLARIGKVPLTPAQQRRLQTSIEGNYLDMVYSRQNSESGSLYNAATRRGGQRLSGAALREARQNFRDWVSMGT